MHDPTPEQLLVANLGPRSVRSPLKFSTAWGDGLGNFLPDEARMLYQPSTLPEWPLDTRLTLERAGPREHIYFDPASARAAIVTCGGLCPGLNNVIRSVFLQLHDNYGVREVLGIRNGYQGLNPAVGQPPVRLTPEYVDTIHKLGGTVLGTSRGAQEPSVVVDFLSSERIDMLFCVGGDGTQRGANAISAEAARRGYPLAVVGIPKTIDNDLNYVWRSFGHITALDKAREILHGAHAEARGVHNGISLVKLMGRDAGFIAAGASVASQEVDFTLIPEIPFALHGENGFLPCLKRRIVAREHAVVVVAEGAGQDLMPAEPLSRDASGNVKPRDIGTFLRDSIVGYFKAEQIPAQVRYFDPSYIIRSAPANTGDSLLCDQLARHAVHAAMAGKTGVLIGFWYNVFIHVPIGLAVAEKRYLDPEGELWMAVLAATGQPARFE
jgi:6-phosphofructokinase 1